MIACFFCADHREWDEKDIVYWVRDAAYEEKHDGLLPHIQITPGVSKVRVEGSQPICPNCLKNLRAQVETNA